MGAAAPMIAAQSASSLGTAWLQADALKRQGKAEEEISNQEARLLELQAEDALARGRVESANVLRKGRFVKGAQHAGYAGQGVAVGTGTAAAVQAETDQMSGMDALTVQNNAFREAWGYRSAATTTRFEGKMKRIGNNNAARDTLLTGGLGAAKDITSGVYLNSKYKDTPVKSKGSTP